MAKISNQEKAMNTGKKILIRQVIESDALDLISIDNFLLKEKEFSELELEEFNMSEAQWKEWINEFIIQDDKLMILAQLSNYVLGYAYYAPFSQQRLKHTGPVIISILKEWRGKGIGTCLLESMIEWTQKHEQIEKIYLSTFANNAKALALAKKFEFEEEGRSPKAIKFNPYQYADKVTLGRFVNESKEEVRPWIKNPGPV